MKQGEAQVEGYDIFIGGALGASSAVARRLGYRVAATDTAETLARLFHAFTHDRLGVEPFSAWVNRVSDPTLRDILAGTQQPAGVAA